MLQNRDTRIERLIAAALVFVGFTEQGGNNKGQIVERFLKDVGLATPLPWCAAFIYHVGYWSQYNEATTQSAWPLPVTGSCLRLFESAYKDGILVKEPKRGDLFLMYVPAQKRLAHTGIILSATPLPDGTFQCQTIEGNTNTAGQREGDSVLIKERVFNARKGAQSDFFVRWSASIQ